MGFNSGVKGLITDDRYVSASGMIRFLLYEKRVRGILDNVGGLES